MNYLLAMDTNILNGIQQVAKCGFLDVIMPVITTLGDNGFLWIGIGILLICIKKYRKIGILLLFVLATGAVLGDLIIKPMVGRIRPFLTHEEITLLIAPPHGYSFPSGHSMSSFGAATVLYYGNKTMGIVGYILAVLIAFSRVYLYVHFPTDVLTGALLGFAYARFVIYLWESKKKKQGRTL